VDDLGARAAAQGGLGDDAVYEATAAEAFPEHNKVHLVSLELPDRSGDVSTSLS
jgi:hypothetical protein